MRRDLILYFITYFFLFSFLMRVFFSGEAKKPPWFACPPFLFYDAVTFFYYTQTNATLMLMLMEHGHEHAQRLSSSLSLNHNSPW